MIKQRFDNGGRLFNRTDENGYIRAEGVVARVGVMEYMEPDGSIIRELVTPECLFDPVSMSTLSGVPVTLHHPPVLVGPDNYSQYSQGSVNGLPRRDGNNLVADFTIVGKPAINAVQSGIDELSPGYGVELDETPGVWEGQHYDRKQTRRFYNHQAIVDAARGGSVCRLNFDCAIAVKPEINDVAKVKLPNGETVDVGDANVAKLLNDSIGAQTKRFDSLKSKVKTTFKAVKKASRNDADDVVLPEDPTDAELETAVEATGEMATTLADQVETLQATVDELTEAVAAAPSDDTTEEVNTDEEGSEEDDGEKRTDAVSKMLNVIESAKKLKPAITHLDSRGKVKPARAIMVEALMEAKQGFNADGKTDAYILGRFDAAVANIKNNKLRESRSGFNADAKPLNEVAGSQQNYNAKFYAGKA